MSQQKMNFCSNCGFKVELKEIENDAILRYYCINCSTVHYSNPNIIAGVLAVWDDKVLLCKRAIEPRKGYWNLPAGFLENNELVEEGAKRECWEEAKGTVEILSALTIFSLPQANQVYIHFLCNLVDGVFGCGVESFECQLFEESEIPWNEMAFASTTFALKRYFEDRKTGKFKTHIGAFKY